MKSITTKTYSIKLFKLLFILIIIFLLYIIISLIIKNNNNNKEPYVDTPETTKTITPITPINPIDSANLPEDSGTCKTKSDIVDFCINYNSCCGAKSDTKECLCNHPFVQDCRTNFETCLKNNPEQLSKADLMKKCIDTNKKCCIEYNTNLSITSDKFKDPIKNEPTINKLCSITSVPNMDQKCLELCSTTPQCVAYSLTTGAVVQDYGTCSLYDTISIAKPAIDIRSGKPIPFISNYYIKK